LFVVFKESKKMILGIGMPRVGDVPSEAVSSHMKCAAQAGLHDDIEDIKILDCYNVFPYDRAREMVIKKAIEEKCDYLLFVDADIVLPLNTFSLLFEVLREKNAVAVSGEYHRRGHPYTSVWSKVIQDSNNSGKSKVTFTALAKKGVHLIHASGLGCCLIDLNWVKANIKPPFFKMGFTDQGEDVWEDAFFFSLLYKAGGKVYGHCGVQCSHLLSRLMVTSENWENLLRMSMKKGIDAL